MSDVKDTTPAGGEVEVLGYRMDKASGNFECSHRDEPVWHYFGNPDEYKVTELVDRAHVTRLTAENARLQAENARLALDEIPKHGRRLLAQVRAERDALQSELTKVRELLNTPHTDDWFEGVRLEAGYQIQRWGAEHDSGKAPADWFWLIGYLAQKAMTAHMSGDENKARHHTISTGAAMLNWFRAIVGDSNSMRPGIEAHQPAPAAKRECYECIGKGGDYELIGESTGAGMSKGQTLMVYRDVPSGRIFHREWMDWNSRMQVKP